MGTKVGLDASENRRFCFLWQEWNHECLWPSHCPGLFVYLWGKTLSSLIQCFVLFLFHLSKENGMVRYSKENGMVRYSKEIGVIR